VMFPKNSSHATVHEKLIFILFLSSGNGHKMTLRRRHVHP
jgi:hypothetical protein